MIDRIKNDQFAKFLGIELLEAGPGAAKAQMPLTTELLNGVGTAHGGAIFALPDFVFAAAANAYDKVAVAIHCDISYVKAISEGTLIAEAEEMSRTSSLGNYSVRVKTAEGDLIAQFQGMAYRKAMHRP